MCMNVCVCSKYRSCRYYLRTRLSEWSKEEKWIHTYWGGWIKDSQDEDRGELWEMSREEEAILVWWWFSFSSLTLFTACITIFSYLFKDWDLCACEQQKQQQKKKNMSFDVRCNCDDDDHHHKKSWSCPTRDLVPLLLLVRYYHLII